MSRVLMLLCCAIVMTGFVGQVSAELIIYDGFEYAEGSLGGSQGGAGWDAGVAWDGTQTVTSPGLEYPGLPVVGNMVASGGTASFRMMPAGFDATNKTIWISFLCQDSATPSWSGISPFDGGSEALFIGKPDTSATWGLALYNAQGDTASTGSKLSEIEVAEKVFFVVRIINGASSAQITAWLNPNAKSEPAVDTAFYDSEAAGETAGRVLFDRIRISGAGAVFYDELRLGETYADVSAAAGLGSASAPSPEDEQEDVPCDTGLSWTAGEFAVTHDVYLGTSFDDVNDAGRGNPLGVLVSQGQSTADYQPAGVLEFGQTYYWRIDEVNAAPDSTIFKGEVWSFTAEPFAYPVENIIATSNGTSDPGAGPEQTVDGSGLSPADEHSIAAGDMWLASPGAEPLYIQYEFDRVYKLYEMLVWNYNVQFELILGFGLKDVTVEYSENGIDWIVLGDVEFARATARADYTANTTVEFNGVAAKYVRLTVNSGYGMMGQYGLGEVRVLYIPAHAREPQPVDGTVDVSPATALSWRAGRDAISHEIYLGTDEQAVADGTALVDTVSESSYTAGSLDFGSTYFWRVNEVQNTESWEGALWSFSTEEFALLDGFESYNDEDNLIYEAWIDGWVNETGSTVGYLEAPFAEKSIVHGGGQSLPLHYDNGASPFYSEAEYDLGGMNLDTNAADSLRLFVSGLAPAFNEAADGTILMNGIGADIWGTTDQFRYAYKSLTGDGSMIARVDSLDNSPSTWAKAGVMIRQGTGTGSQHAFSAATGGDGGGASFQRRINEGIDSTSDNDLPEGPFVMPTWVKIERVGNAFSSFFSVDGANWIQAGETLEIAMDDPVLIGLALTSHLATQATSAQFSNVSFTGNVTGAWQIAEIGATQPAGNAPAALYVALEDSGGNVAVVTHPDPVLSARSGWTEWTIPYSTLTGINLNSVNTMYIGVGDRDNPAASGTGTVFLDDIGYGRPAAGE